MGKLAAVGRDPLTQGRGRFILQVNLGAPGEQHGRSQILQLTLPWAITWVRGDQSGRAILRKKGLQEESPATPPSSMWRNHASSNCFLRPDVHATSHYNGTSTRCWWFAQQMKPGDDPSSTELSEGLISLEPAAHTPERSQGEVDEKEHETERQRYPHS